MNDGMSDGPSDSDKDTAKKQAASKKTASSPVTKKTYPPVTTPFGIAPSGASHSRPGVSVTI